MSRVRSWLAAPAAARLLGVACAVAGVVLLAVGLVALNRGDEGRPPGAAPTSSAPPSAAASPTTTEPGSSAPATTTTAPRTTPPRTTPRTTRPPAPRPAPARAPLTVLNNSTVTGLGERVAASVRQRGWQVAAVGNFGGRLPQTTVYYTPGDAAQERAARQLAADFPQVRRIYPRYAGLPPTPSGIVLVVTRSWLD